MNTEEYPAPSANAPRHARSDRGRSCSRRWAKFGTLPPTAVTQGESSQAAVSGVAEVLSHWLLAMARFCTTPQSPVATSTGMPVRPPR